MTQEEKAKAYDEAKARMSRAFNSIRCTIGFMNEIFPELAESEDEKIRKAIIATIHLYYGEPLEDEAKDMIAWFEKQGEQKSMWTEEDEELLQHCCGAVAAADYYTLEDKEEMENWLKSLKQRMEE